jgi:hypothetical protein
MVDSGYSDKTAGREDGLLKIRYANRYKAISCRFTSNNRSSVLREAEFEQPVQAACAFAHQIPNYPFARPRSPTGCYRERSV